MCVMRFGYILALFSLRNALKVILEFPKSRFSKRLFPRTSVRHLWSQHLRLFSVKKCIFCALSVRNPVHSTATLPLPSPTLINTISREKPPLVKNLPKTRGGFSLEHILDPKIPKNTPKNFSPAAGFYPPKHHFWAFQIHRLHFAFN